VCSNQYGFRDVESTETAAHSLITNIQNGFVEKKLCAFAFDIKSTFDTVWLPAISSEEKLSNSVSSNSLGF
jgi:hypothetical protein